MAIYFVDTSACVKRYHLEAGTLQMDALFAENHSQLLISRLGAVEMVSAFAMKVRTGDISPEKLLHVQKRLYTDVSQRVLSVVRVLARHFEGAEKLLHRHATSKRLRTLDAIQLAIAIDLGRSRNLDYFVCADRVLCDIARSEGLACIDPLQT